MAKKKKPTTPKEGIFIRKNSRGFYATIKQNKFKLTMLGGYNTKASVQKGLRAIHGMLNGAHIPFNDKYRVIDLTKAK